MNNTELLNHALQLNPQDRFLIVEGLLKSLDEPDENLDQLWAEEAQKRLLAYRSGSSKGIPMEDIFKE
jgi:hypothetical protein